MWEFEGIQHLGASALMEVGYGEAAPDVTTPTLTSTVQPRKANAVKIRWKNLF